jgi:hypothetical protein
MNVPLSSSVQESQEVVSKAFMATAKYAKHTKKAGLNLVCGSRVCGLTIS